MDQKSPVLRDKVRIDGTNSDSITSAISHVFSFFKRYATRYMTGFPGTYMLLNMITSLAGIKGLETLPLATANSQISSVAFWPDALPTFLVRNFKSIISHPAK